MIETLTVSLSGPAFSFLLYENLKDKFSQEGFLIGEIVEKETKSITDNDQQQIHISRTIQVSCAVPCPKPFRFYDGVGRIEPEKIVNFLGNLTPKVVAWYKYKPLSSFNFTFRERIIHKQLATLFTLPPEFFSCCLLISESSDNNSTHSFTQTFIRCHTYGYEQLPMHIVNLSDANNIYKSPEQVSETFSNIISDLKPNFKKTQGINFITKIQNALQKHTENIVESLAEAEKRLFQLESEVKNGQINKQDPTSASNNNDILMDTDSEVSPTKNRERAKVNVTPKMKRNQSPVKRSPGGREILTRSKKKV